MQSLRDKYAELVSRATSSSIDYGRLTIYSFPKHCKHCGEGLAQGKVRIKKSLWRKSYCSEECQELGPSKQRKYSLTAKSGGHPTSSRELAMEELAFIGLQIEREESKLPPMIRLVVRADKAFNLLSEKLSFLEIESGEEWTPSKFYYWLNKI